MSCTDNNKVFVEWEEQVISQEKGSRVVHYYLKHFSGDSVLSVVGTERSIRHMIYVVSDDLINAYGHMRIVNPGTKWRSKREVVEWLTKVVSKYHQSNLQTTKSTESLVMVSRNFQLERSNIVWSGDSWICSKQLLHYPAFSRNGVTIGVNSFAYIMGEEERSYLAYLQDLYEDKKGQKKAKVRWFHHHEEVKHVIPELNAHPREVFITPHEQVISVECIDGIALVLTPSDYVQYTVLNSQSSSSVVMCHREFKNNKLKLFSVSKMRGYSNQITKFHSTHQRLKIIFSSSLSSSSFKVGDKIEVLCQDSGVRGCWFRCKILQTTQNRIKVEYYDLEDVEGPGKLEEWVPSSRVAASDKLGMRREGRLTVRPWPCENALDLEDEIQIGKAVDAWWSDGWWEGVVIHSLIHTLQVYFPGENKVVTVQRNDVRISRDYSGGKWVEIKNKSDILSVVSSNMSVKMNSGEASGSGIGGDTSATLEADEDDDEEEIPKCEGDEKGS